MRIILPTIIVLSIISQTPAQQDPKPGWRNIALNKPYTMIPMPNYPHCREDNRQLTDGKFGSDSNILWLQKETVGWSLTNTVLIKIDLGKISSIRGVALHTAAGMAGVMWPKEIQILVADHPNEFHKVGELINMTSRSGQLPGEVRRGNEGYRTAWFRTDRLRTHGRYVTFAISGMPYIFADELEVYEGDPKWLSIPWTGQTIPNIDSYMVSTKIQAHILRLLHSDWKVIYAKAQNSNLPPEIRGTVLSDLDKITRSMKESCDIYGKEYRAILPLSPLHRELFKTQAKLWRAEGRKPLVIWTSGLWEKLFHLADPKLEEHPLVRVDMMLNEYRAGAFNITNTTSESMTLKLCFSKLPGGVIPKYITVHEVAWTDTFESDPVAAALPLADQKENAYLLHVPSGLTRQVWLTFHPTTLAPGSYEGEIRLDNENLKLVVPIQMNVYPIRFPDRPTLHMGGFDYLSQPQGFAGTSVTPAIKDVFLKTLREHFVDSPWGGPEVFPPGRYDAQGNMLSMPDTSTFDKWVSLWPDARRFYIHAAVGETFDKFPMGTPAFSLAVTSWIKFWADHADRKGIKADHVYVLLVDEPSTPEQDKIIFHWSSIIRNSNTGIKIWEDSSDARDTLLTSCDVLCPNVNAGAAILKAYLQCHKRGLSLEFYNCDGPVCRLDPYAYHRLAAWVCWKYGGDAFHLWALGGDAIVEGSSSWNEYINKTPGYTYTPMFIDANSVTTGKHFEACREGIEDYEYFVILKKAISEAEKNGRDPQAISRAKTLLNEGPDRVLRAGTSKSLRWKEKVNRSLADQVRKDLLTTISSLQSQENH